MVVGFSLWCLLLLQSTGSKHVGVSSCGPQAQLPSACRIFPDRGLNPHPLLWQADSYPLDHQEVPTLLFVLPQCSVFGEGNGNPLQYSCLEKSHEQRSLASYSPRVAKSRTRLKKLSMHRKTRANFLVNPIYNPGLGKFWLTG